MEGLAAVVVIVLFQPAFQCLVVELFVPLDVKQTSPGSIRGSPLIFFVVQIRSEGRLTPEDHIDRCQLGDDQNLLSSELSSSEGMAGLTLTMRVRGLMAILQCEREW